MSELTGNRAHCSSCHKTFRGDAGFDKHRVGSYRPEDPRRCMTTEEMLEAGMVQNAKGLWVTEAWDPTVTHSERKKGRDASPLVWAVTQSNNAGNTAIITQSDRFQGQKLITLGSPPSYLHRGVTRSSETEGSWPIR